ncbi:hypothetical protein ZIOFF_010952 [Zingiber officinale]|uniref:S1-like domain-containing protein n=1 Tax=Zingiber officinale TaxID=94328 RepID=A0A8J5LYZ1_ZINOF|nr:hypothetical protein ZIOFF_010952 [Zingiber officinale]
MHKKVWTAAGDIILAGLRDYQDDKANIIFKYMPDEARLLKAYGELPENIRLNEGIRGLNEEDEGGADDYIEGDQKVLDGERKKDFQKMEKVHGRLVNILEGLGLHAGVFSPAEQKQIVDCIYAFQKKGRNSELRERTYSEPRKWMHGQVRIIIQFGCCYNYAVVILQLLTKHRNPPGIIRDEQVDPIPPLLKFIIKRMVAWRVLPTTCIPNSCIVNIYDKDDCIPPHIDHHDFLRPFCTVSFLSECNILFGTVLKVLGPGEFSGSTAIPLPVGYALEKFAIFLLFFSVLILNGNGAEIAKHCVPAVPSSITPTNSIWMTSLLLALVRLATRRKRSVHLDSESEFRLFK